MKWLVDAQLPPRLCAWFRSKGDVCTHIVELPSGLTLSDQMLWDYAAEKNLVIVTKDRDSFQRSMLYGAPPQVFYIRVGNCSNEELISILHNSWNVVCQALRSGNKLVALTRAGVHKF